MRDGSPVRLSISSPIDGGFDDGLDLAARYRFGLGMLLLNEHIEADGPTVFAPACKMGLEGIVSKRKGSPYVSGRSPYLIKSKNAASEAVRRA